LTIPPYSDALTACTVVVRLVIAKTLYSGLKAKLGQIFAVSRCTKFSTPPTQVMSEVQIVLLQAGLAMNGIFEVLGENKKYIEFYSTARARRPRARADHAT
jgi:hypothetical protein